MYTIEIQEGCLLVRFESDFDMNTIRALMHHETTLKEYPSTNDLWMIGGYHARIRLGELDEMVKDFEHCCPEQLTRTKTAVVAAQGLTQAILKLWISAVRKKVPFEIRLFDIEEEALAWLGARSSLVA